jgi:hypothetical protein
MCTLVLIPLRRCWYVLHTSRDVFIRRRLWRYDVEGMVEDVEEATRRVEGAGGYRTDADSSAGNMAWLGHVVRCISSFLRLLVACSRLRGASLGERGCDLVVWMKPAESWPMGWPAGKMPRMLSLSRLRGVGHPFPMGVPSRAVVGRVWAKLLYSDTLLFSFL